MSRRILVLSFHAPPDLAVGGLRWWSLSRHMVERGWEVRMVTASPRADQMDVPDGMTVQPVPRRTTLQDRYRRVRVKGSGVQEGGVVESAPTDTSRSLIRNELSALLAFPDDGRGWLLRGAGVARVAIREWTPDVVVSTGPPHSVHLAARLALRGTTIPWVVDLRDPWATPWHIYTQSGWVPAVTRWLERSVLRRATRTLTTTPELQEVLEARYPNLAVKWLPNGVDIDELPARSETLPEGLSLTHLGSVYFNRDPTPVIRAFARFLTSSPGAAEAGSSFRFVGHISPEFRARLDRTATDLGIQDRIMTTPTVPRDEALRILAGSHMALVLAQGQDVMVPAKIYESVAMGLPTLVVAERDSAAGTEALRLGAIVHEPDEVSEMAETLGHLWADGLGRSVEPPPRVARRHLAGQLEGILRDMGVAGA